MFHVRIHILPLLRTVLALLLFATLSVQSLRAADSLTVLYVGSGQNAWSGRPNVYPDLSSALNRAVTEVGAQAGQKVEIWVAKGTYKPNSGAGRNDTFNLVNNVAVLGGFAGTETIVTQRNPSLNVTTLSGDIGTSVNTDNVYHVVGGTGTNATAILDGFTIIAGVANGSGPYQDSGGGMFNNQGNPTLINVTFRGNYGVSCGAMLNVKSSPTLTNVIFDANSAEQTGSICNTVQSNPTLKNVTIQNSYARGGRGGAMFNTGQSAPILNNVVFTNNTSENNGGAIFSTDGAILTMTDSTFTANSAVNGNGGALYATLNSQIKLTNVTFSNNKAQNDNGGAIAAIGTTAIEMIGGSFQSNLANQKGGAMYVTGSGTLNFKDVLFESNKSINGGGLYNNKTQGQLANVVFKNNMAESGGGVWNENGTNLQFNAVIWSSNNALYGGGMSNSASNPTIIDSTFLTNRASSGGGMANFGGSPVLRNVIFNGNTAKQDNTTSARNGGAIDTSQGGRLTLTNVVLAGNAAETQGGAIHSYTTPLTLRNVTIAGNRAGTGGAGIHNNSSNITTIYNSVFAGNATLSETGASAQIFAVGGEPDVRSTLVQGGATGSGNLNGSPQFVRNPDPGLDDEWGTGDDDYGNVRLQSSSPAVDAGENAFVTSNPTDLIGNPRLVDYKRTGTPRVDMGAFETIDPGVSVSSAAITVSEGGTSAQYTVVLNSKPSSNIVMTIISSSQTTTNPTSVIFTPTNWSIPQTITVAAVDDTVVEGVHMTSITHSISSLDEAYNGIASSSVNVTINDNDAAASKRFVHFPLISR